MRGFQQKQKCFLQAIFMRQVLGISGRVGCTALLTFILVQGVLQSSYAQNSTLPNYFHLESRDLDRINVKWADLFDFQSKANSVIIGVEVNPEGEIFVLTYGNGIKKVTTDGTFQNFISGTNFNAPMDFAINSEGKFYVAVNSTEGKNIKVFSPTGIALPGENLSNGNYGTGVNYFKGPVGIAFDSRDNLYVADHFLGMGETSEPSRIKIFYKINGGYKNSQFLEFTSIEETNVISPFRIAVNNEGLVFVADQGSDGKGRVLVIEIENRVPKIVDVLAGAEDNIGSPGDIVIDPLGYIHIADLGQVNLPVILNSGNDPYKLIDYFDAVKNGIRDEVFKIRVYDPQRQYQGYLLNQIDFPLDMAIDQCGQLYINNLVLSGSKGSAPFYFGLDATLDFDLEIYKRSPSADITDPVALCKGSHTIDLAAGETETLDPNLFDNGSYDACGGVTLDLSKKIFTEADAGLQSIDFIVTDENGNTSICQVLVQVNVQNVSDTESPVFDCPGNIIRPNNAGECGAIVTFSAPDATDNAGTVTVVQTGGPASGSFFPVGATTVTFRATDAAGNFSDCSFNVIVEDDEDPVFTSCPENISATVAFGETGKIITFLTPEFTDNCSGVSMKQTSGFASGEVFSIGETTVAFEITDASGNKNTCSFKVIISTEEDTEPPVFNCPGSITRTNDAGKCGAIVTFSAPDATDNAGTVTVVQAGGPGSGSSFPAGATTVTFRATDAAGNFSDCSFDVIVEDDEDPEFTSCPENISATVAFGETGKIITFLTPEYTDNCSGPTMEQTAGPASGEEFPVGETTVNFAVTDEAGNKDTCSFTVTISEGADTQAPVFTNCPGKIEQVNDSGTCGAKVTFSAPEATDNSGELPTVEQTGGPASGSTFPVGSTTVTFTATDAAGNFSGCSFEVIVRDDEAPVFSCPGESISLEPDSNGKFWLPDLSVMASDNCAVTDVVQLPAADTEITSNVTVQIKAQDAAGNEVECSVDVILLQNQLLEITSCAPSGTVEMGQNCSFVLPDYTVEITTNIEAEITQDPPAGTVITTATEISLIAEANGQTDACTFQVDLKDSTSPVIVCPSNKTESLNSETGFKVPDYRPEATVTDNCGLEVVQDPAPGTIIFGSRFVHLTAIDASDNEAFCSFELRLTEEEAPHIDCIDAVIELDDTGNASLEASSIFAGDALNSNIDKIELSRNSFTCEDVGEPQSVTLSVTYLNGQTLSCTSSITVVDEIAPVAACTGDYTVTLNENGAASISAEDMDNGSSDNCRITAKSLSQSTFTSADIGTVSVTLTVTDEGGLTDTCTVNVTVKAATNPGEPLQITCPGDQTMQPESDCEYLVPDFTMEAVTNDPQAVVTQMPEPGTVISENTIVELTVSRGVETASCSFKLNLLADTTPPVAVCREGFTLYLNREGYGVISANILDGGSSDNCGIEEMSLNKTRFDTSDLGEKPVTLTVTDFSGNIDTCETTINIQPFSDVSVTCPDSIRLPLNENGETILGLSYSGNPDNVEIDISRTDFSCSDIGTEVITATYWGEFTGTCIIPVNIVDDRPPGIECVGEFELDLRDGGTGNISVEDLLLNATDNCGIKERSLSRSTFTPADAGPQEVTVFVTDHYNNTASCTVIVNVLSSEEPGSDPVTCLTSIELALNEDGFATLDPADLFTGGFDDLEITVDQTSFTCADVGEQKVNFSYTSAEAEGTCEISVVVTDPLNSCEGGPVDPVDPPETEATVILFPNPGDGNVYIKADVEVGLKRAQIFDMRGRFLFSQALDETQELHYIDLTGFQSGVYSVHLNSDSREYLERAIITTD